MKDKYRIFKLYHLPVEGFDLMRRMCNGYKKKIDIGDKKNTKMVAHRGLSALYKENTIASFTAAGKESYFGIETDVHLTDDDKYVIIHDDVTGRVAKKDIYVETSTLAELQALELKPKNGDTSPEGTKIPILDDYINVCKKYDKYCILELKNHFEEKNVLEIIDIIKNYNYLDKMIFISFDWENCLTLRKISSDFNVQFLSARYDRKLLQPLKENHIDLDVYYRDLSKRVVDTLHENGIKINCWTVNSPRWGKKLVERGVDYITTNCLV